MKFIHIADVHLGSSPEAGKAYTRNRKKEIWDTFERVIEVCETEKADLLLIAGDLFHRQPLLRELKEVDYLFSKMSHTKVVLIAGNHDHVKPDSYYRTYQWKSQVYFLLDTTLDYVEFPELETCVYGLSYAKKEILEPLYDAAYSMKKQKIEILLAHGGDEKHIPINKKRILELGYDYVAFGHIHRVSELVPGRIVYAGSLEPTDINDIGSHGYFQGTIENGKSKVEFVPFAMREYVPMEVKVTEQMAVREIRDKIADEIKARGISNCYKITLHGFTDQKMELDVEQLDSYGNIVEVQDLTQPAYDFERIQEMNSNNLLGKYIERFEKQDQETVEYRALVEGVQALLNSKKGETCSSKN